MPLRNAGGSARTVHAYVAETKPATGPAGVGVAFFDARGRVLRTMRQALPQAARGRGPDELLEDLPLWEHAAAN